MGLSTRHRHYATPNDFSRLAETIVRALLNYHAARRASSVPHIPEGQYLVLHRVEKGYYIPIFVHVQKSYSGHEVVVHPAPLDDHMIAIAKAKRIHVPYGKHLIRILENALNGKKISPNTSVEQVVMCRLITKRSREQHVPLPEYGDSYLANHLLQEVGPDTDIYALKRDNVFVLDYHVHDDRVEANLQPFDPQVHGPVSLKTVWSEEHYPLHILDPERYSTLRAEVGRQRHLRPRIRE